MQHSWHGQIESFVIDGDAREAACRVGEAVIGAEPGDDLLLLGLSAQVVVVPDQLEVGVVGVRAAGTEEHLREVRCTGLVVKQAEHPLGQANDGLVRGAAEDVIVGEVLDRLLGGLGHLLAAVPNVDAPQAGAAVDQLSALVVLHAHAARLGQDVWALLEVIDDGGVRMEHGLAIDVLERIVAGRLVHAVSFWRDDRCQRNNRPGRADFEMSKPAGREAPPLCAASIVRL